MLTGLIVIRTFTGGADRGRRGARRGEHSRPRNFLALRLGLADAVPRRTP